MQRTTKGHPTFKIKYKIFQVKVPLIDGFRIISAFPHISAIQKHQRGTPRPYTFCMRCEPMMQPCKTISRSYSVKNTAKLSPIKK